MATTSASAEPDFDRAELRATLDEEVRRLPTKFREPIVLCYLDGLTHDEAAAHLRCPVGTVRSRLATGRDKLRARLVRRGVTVPSAVFASAFTAETASAAVSPALLLTTVRASTAFAAGMAGATAAGLVSAAVASLAEGVTTTMIVSKLKIVAGLALVGMMTLGVGGATARFGTQGKGEQPPADTLEAQIARLRQQAETAEARARKLEAENERLAKELENANGREMNALAALRMTKRESAVNATATTPQGQTTGVGRLGIGVPGGPGMGAALTGVGGGIGGGELTSMGPPVVPPGLQTAQSEEFVIVHKPKSDKVNAFSTETGEWTSYPVPKGVLVVPFYTPSLVALRYTGKEIRQLATFVPKLGQWFPIDLQEPGHEDVFPIIRQSQAAYVVGRRVYAFSGTAHAWDLLELPEGAKPTAIVMPNRTTVEYEDHLYIFNAKTGKWSGFDAKAGEVLGPGFQ